MKGWTRQLSWIVLALAGVAGALEPNEILVLVNGQIPESMQVGRYYCQQRKVPQDNIVSIALGAGPVDTISREDYDRLVAGTIREVIASWDEPASIRCIVTTWGVPFRVGDRPAAPGTEQRIQRLKAELEDAKKAEAKDQAALRQWEAELDRLTGGQTQASLDSELAVLLFGDYELYRWIPNTFKDNQPDAPYRVLMVSRLDGPSPEIARGLVDKALAAEKKGLQGTFYIDARGLTGPSEYARYDQSLRDLAGWATSHTSLPVKLDDAPALFAPGTCPNAALYCGWYSLGKYVDAFTFVEGAVAIHIASFEAVTLRDPNSTEWCPAMLRHGVAATVGAVSEPYLTAFPLPLDFFKELFEGRCLAEAYYRTNPFNSWQMVLIGDPLYRPFHK